MPGYYYIDLYLDPAKHGFVQSIVSASECMVESGMRLLRAAYREDQHTGMPDYFEHGTEFDLSNIADSAEGYLKDRLSRGARYVSFPPWGRLVFKCGFRFDEEMLEDLNTEQQETRSNADEIGIGFVYEKASNGTGRMKATITLWEDYVLSGSRHEDNIYNMRLVMDAVVRLYDALSPYFCAMNNEIKLDSDGALNTILNGKLPASSCEFAIAGPHIAKHIDIEGLNNAGAGHIALKDGGMIIVFSNRFKDL